MKPNTPLTALALASALAAGTLAACRKTDPAPTAGTSDPAPATLLVVSDARLVLPAVPGNPAALYFGLANPGQGAVELDGIAVAGAASTQMHEMRGPEMADLPRLPLAAGSTASFAPGGRHVMVFGLDPAPRPGQTVAITLSFTSGPPLVATAKVETVGGAMSAQAAPAMDDMPGMSGH